MQIKKVAILTASFILLVSSFMLSSCKNCSKEDNESPSGDNNEKITSDPAPIISPNPDDKEGASGSKTTDGLTIPSALPSTWGKVQDLKDLLKELDDIADIQGAAQEVLKEDVAMARQAATDAERLFCWEVIVSNVNNLNVGVSDVMRTRDKLAMKDLHQRLYQNRVGCGCGCVYRAEPLSEAALDASNHARAKRDRIIMLENEKARTLNFAATLGAPWAKCYVDSPAVPSPVVIDNVKKIAQEAEEAAVWAGAYFRGGECRRGYGKRVCNE
jgi:hypothetical protein